MSSNPATSLDPATSRDPATAKRPKTGGRKKGTPNKSTVALREAILQVFADLQAGTDRENGHFLDWARRNPSKFYTLTSRLLPRPVPVPEGRPAISALRRLIVGSNGQVADRAGDQPSIPEIT